MSKEEKKAIEILRFSTLIKGRKPENDAVEIILNLIKKQAEEIEEKQTIIYAGAEKVTILEEEIEELKIINNMQKYRIEVIDERELIPKSKIEAIRKYINNTTMWSEADYEYTLVKKTQIGKDILELLESEE